MWSNHYSSPILIEIEFSRQIFDQYWNILFHEIPSSGSGVILCGEMDRYDGENSSFSQFGERA